MTGFEWECPTYKVMRKWADDGCPGYSWELEKAALQELTRVGEKRGKYERKKGE